MQIRVYYQGFTDRLKIKSELEFQSLYLYNIYILDACRTWKYTSEISKIWRNLKKDCFPRPTPIDCFLFTQAKREGADGARIYLKEPSIQWLPPGDYTLEFMQK